MKYDLNYFVDLAIKTSKIKQKLIVTCPYEEYSIGSIVKCVELELIDVIFVGEKDKILEAAKKAQIDLPDSVEIVETIDDLSAAKTTMEYLRDKKATILMKGLIDTSVLLKTMLAKEYGLRTKRVMSHCCVSFNEDYNKYYLITDAAMLIKPNLEQKKQMILNAVDFAHALGIEKPMVANLCAKEKAYEKMPDTLEAAKLQEMYINGEITGCVVSGPLQIDTAISVESASIKGTKDPVAGKADILVCPNIEAANIFSKGIVYLGG